MPEVTFDQMTKKQLLVHIAERQELMAQELDNLNAAVDKELADDAAQNQLIADLQARLGEAQTALEAAQAGEADALAQAREALDAAQANADKLASNDAPTPSDDAA